jgi:hypothetical protein
MGANASPTYPTSFTASRSMEHQVLVINWIVGAGISSKLRLMQHLDAPVMSLVF